MSKVFISYHHRDFERVRHIVAGIAAAGVACWIDQQMTPGVKWPEEVAKAIDTCTHVLVMVGRGQRSEWQMREILYAQSAGKVIVPVRLYRFSLRGAVRLMLEEYEWVESWKRGAVHQISEAVKHG